MRMRVAARWHAHRYNLEQGPRPNGECEVHLVTPWTVSGEIIDSHKNQRYGKGGSDLSGKRDDQGTFFVEVGWP